MLIGPITQCCCCTAFKESERNQWRLFAVIALITLLPFLILSLFTFDHTYQALYSLSCALYFIPKSIMDLRENRETTSKYGCKPEYLYIVHALLMVVTVSIYVPFTSGCSNNENGYSDVPGDDNYCPYPVEFNHNAVLHVCQLVAIIPLLFGVLIEDENQNDTEEDKTDVEMENPKQNGDVSNGLEPKSGTTQKHIVVHTDTHHSKSDFSPPT